jgi:hypothetical protein
MDWWPKIREGALTVWYSLLDYDRKFPAEKRRIELERRNSNRLARLVSDDKKRRVKNRQRQVQLRERQQAAELELMPDMNPPHDREQDQGAQIIYAPVHRPQFRGAGICPACGRGMKKGARSTDSGSGCLISIVGLFLTPILCGIPPSLLGFIT